MPPPPDSALPAPSSRGIAAAFGAGALRALPLLIVVVPFGLVFGLAASRAGLSLTQVLAFSTLVLAGASQITALQLMVDGAPLVIVLLSALAVNLRMAMYSAALVPWLGRAPAGMRALVAYLLIDQTFALSLRRYEDGAPMAMAERLAFFFGTAVVLAVPWAPLSALGATIGQAIPPRYAIDFAVAIAFLAMVGPQLRARPHLAAAVVGFGLSAALSGLPSGLNLLIAAPVAMAVGAALERRLERRAALAS